MTTPSRLGKHLLPALVLSCSSLVACCGMAAQPSDGDGPPRKPPPEALQACQGLKAGQDCSFTSPHGAVKGTCWAPEGKPLACRPKDAPPQPPPPAK